MMNKKNNIKSIIELIISNIDEFDSEFVMHKAGTMKLLLQNILEYIENKEEEYEELRQYHNKCCEENTEKLKQWLEKYDQLSRDFYNGKYCNKENCGLLKAKEQKLDKIRNIATDDDSLVQDYETAYDLAVDILQIIEGE
nr:MAG TPA: hypothetical protein [Caudoviricetes sp.]